MRKVLLLAFVCLALAGCNNKKEINGVRYDVFGLANYDEKKNPTIEYEVSIGSVIAAVIFSETIIVPIYVACFDLWQPVGPAMPIKGQTNR